MLTFKVEPTYGKEFEVIGTDADNGYQDFFKFSVTVKKGWFNSLEKEIEKAKKIIEAVYHRHTMLLEALKVFKTNSLPITKKPKQFTRFRDDNLPYHELVRYRIDDETNFFFYITQETFPKEPTIYPVLEFRIRRYDLWDFWIQHDHKVKYKGSVEKTVSELEKSLQSVLLDEKRREEKRIAEEKEKEEKRKKAQELSKIANS